MTQGRKVFFCFFFFFHFCVQRLSVRYRYRLRFRFRYGYRFCGLKYSLNTGYCVGLCQCFGHHLVYIGTKFLELLSMRQFQFLHGASLFNTDLLRITITITKSVGLVGNKCKYYKLKLCYNLSIIDLRSESESYLFLLHKPLHIVLTFLTQTTILLVLSLQCLVVLHILGGLRGGLGLLGIQILDISVARCREKSRDRLID